MTCIWHNGRHNGYASLAQWASRCSVLLVAHLACCSGQGFSPPPSGTFTVIQMQMPGQTSAPPSSGTGTTPQQQSVVQAFNHSEAHEKEQSPRSVVQVFNHSEALVHEAHEKEQIWGAYYHQLQRSRVNNQSLLDLLGPLMHYKHDLPLKQLRKSLAYKGSGSRLRHVLHQLITGNGTVKVGVVGTSISWGTGAGAWKGV